MSVGTRPGPTGPSNQIHTERLAALKSADPDVRPTILKLHPYSGGPAIDI
jgi:hypothetical protein